MDIWIISERILVAVEALVEIGLARHSEKNDIAFAAELLDESLTAEAPGLTIVGADEVEAAAVRGIRIDRDEGNARVDSGVDFGLQQLLVGYGDEDAGGFESDNRSKFFDLGLRIEGGWPTHIGMHAVEAGDLVEAGGGGLPVGEFDVRSNEVVVLGAAVPGASRKRGRAG